MRRLDYRWVILATGFTVLFFSGGSRFAFGLALKPRSDDLGWTRSSLSLMIAVFMVVSALAMPVIGRLIDRFSPQLVIGAAAIALAQLPHSVFDKVLFAWGGLGAAFGPALVLSLWWPGTTRNGVLAGMLAGFFTVIIWDNMPWGGALYSLVPGFLVALLVVVVVSLTENRGG